MARTVNEWFKALGEAREAGDEVAERTALDALRKLGVEVSFSPLAVTPVETRLPPDVAAKLEGRR